MNLGGSGSAAGARRKLYWALVALEGTQAFSSLLVNSNFNLLLRFLDLNTPAVAKNPAQKERQIACSASKLLRYPSGDASDSNS